MLKRGADLRFNELIAISHNYVNSPVSVAWFFSSVSDGCMLKRPHKIFYGTILFTHTFDDDSTSRTMS